jgi:hypothetical protein
MTDEERALPRPEDPDYFSALARELCIRNGIRNPDTGQPLTEADAWPPRRDGLIEQLCVPGCTLHPEHWKIPDAEQRPAVWVVRDDAAEKYYRYQQRIDAELQRGGGSLHRLPIGKKGSIRDRDDRPFQTSIPRWDEQ